MGAIKSLRILYNTSLRNESWAFLKSMISNFYIHIYKEQNKLLQEQKSEIRNSYPSDAAVTLMVTKYIPDPVQAQSWTHKATHHRA
jgi:hypothetical protein